jgi:bifunctional DNA-binding transcriptional regulator/antitoxin component of YhaV-PrlF toxin-antitoxin module
MAKVKRIREARTRISLKHQVTIPSQPFDEAGLQEGDRLRAEAQGPGRILLVREDDPLERFSGALTGVYPPGELDRLRDEWG